MTQLPVVVGDVYLIGGVARIKVTISLNGDPLLGESPTITVVRDDDNFAADFDLLTFVDYGAPAGLDVNNLKFNMTELGLGTYFADFDPALFGSFDEEVYTAIVKNEGDNAVVAHEEFTISNNLAVGTGTGFGIVDRCCNVCLNTPFVVSYEATTGQTDVILSVYNPFNTLLESNVTMTELDSTGIYQFTFIGQIDGDHTFIMSEATFSSREALVITIGGDCDRLKRIEQMLRDLSLNPPTVGPCQ